MAKSDQTRPYVSNSPRAQAAVRKDKFLVEWVKGVSHKQLFFGIWALLVISIAAAMMAYFKRVTRRNFRNDGDGLPPVFTKRNPNPLPSGKGNQVSVSERSKKAGS